MKDMLGRPSWNDVLMAMTFVLKQRSMDSTKHGCLAVDQHHAILSGGYNGPPRGSIDNNIPLDRPAKYDFIIHSEDNTILNAARNGIKLDNSNFIVSGRPCSRCLRSMISAGSKEIIYGPTQSHMVNEEDMKVQDQLLIGQKVKIKEYEGSDFVDVLLSALDDAEKCGIDVKVKIKEKFGI